MDAFFKGTAVGFALVGGLALMLFVPGWLGLGPPGSYLVHRRWLIAKADAGDREAMYAVARAYEEIGMSREDAALAQAWYVKAAERGHPLAIWRLSADRRWMERGLQLKVEPCLGEAARAWELGLNGGRIDLEKAQQIKADLARIRTLRMALPFGEGRRDSFNGLEVEAQFELRRQFLERRFQQGHPEVGMDLFHLFEDTDPGAALSWLRRGAELDSTCAKFLADAYQSGSHGLPEDKEAFYRWFLRSRELEKRPLDR